MHMSAYKYLAIISLCLYLDQWPLVGLIKQLNNGRNSIVKPHRVLCHFSLWMPTGEVPQSTHSWLSDVFFVSSSENSVYEGFNSIRLSYQGFILAVVASQIGECTSGTGQHIDII